MWHAQDAVSLDLTPDAVKYKQTYDSQPVNKKRLQRFDFFAWPDKRHNQNLFVQIQLPALPLTNYLDAQIPPYKFC